MYRKDALNKKGDVSGSVVSLLVIFVQHCYRGNLSDYTQLPLEPQKLLCCFFFHIYSRTAQDLKFVELLFNSIVQCFDV